MKAVPDLRLVAVGTLLSPAADVIAGKCIAGLPWSLDLSRLLGSSLCLFAAVMVLGARRQHLAPKAALILGLLLVLTGVALSPVRVCHGSMAALVLAWEYGFKRSAWAAAAGMGVLRGLNLVAPSLLALGPEQLLPAPTACYAGGAFALYYAAAVGLRRQGHGTMDQGTVRQLLAVALVIPLVGLALMPEPWPAIAIAFFMALLWFAHHRRELFDADEVAAASTSLLEATMAFAALLCLAADRPWDALAVVGMLVAASLLGLRHGLQHLDLRGRAPAPPPKETPPVPPPPPVQPAPRAAAPEPVDPGPAATTQVAAKKVAAPPRIKKNKKQKPPRKPIGPKSQKPLIPTNLMVYLRLLRVGTLFSPAADVIAGHCVGNVPWSGELWKVLAASVCLYGAGMVLNDHADRKLDAQLRPERPLPQGQIEPDTVLGFGLLLMLVGLLITPVPIYHGVMAGLVLAYDYWLKSTTWVGALAMGLLRGMNLTAGAVLGMAAGSVLPPEPVLYAAGAYAVYIIAVTLLGAMEDDTSSQKAIRGLICVPPLVAFLALLGMPQPWPAVGIVFVLMAILFARHRHREWGRAEVRAAMTWLLLGTMAYTSLLCLASGHGWEALIVALMVVPARLIAAAISLT